MKRIISLFMVITLIFIFCGCEKASDQNDEYGEEIQKNTQQLEEHVENINKQIEAIEQSLTVIQEELTTEEIVEFPTEITKEDPTAPTTAFDVWIEAEIANPERYRYEMIIDGLANSTDEYARGWLDEGTIKLLRLIKGDTVSEAAWEEDFISVYRSLDVKIGGSSYCIRDFFCVDEYGYSINGGVYHFFEAINELEDEKFGGRNLVHMSNGEVSGWDFEDAEVASALGISEELVDIIVHAAVDAGFQVNFD